LLEKALNGTKLQEARLKEEGHLLTTTDKGKLKVEGFEAKLHRPQSKAY